METTTFNIESVIKSIKPINIDLDWDNGEGKAVLNDRLIVEEEDFAVSLWATVHATAEHEEETNSHYETDRSVYVVKIEVYENDELVNLSYNEREALEAAIIENINF